MRDDKGRLIRASAAFRAMRDQLQISDPALERRRIGFERMFQTLAKVGLKRKDLFQAWDFTVASTPNATERAVDIRDNAFAVLGDNNLVDRNPKGGAPRFALDAPQEFAPCGTDGCQPGENDLLARTVTGVMTVPCYLNKTGCPVGSTFRYRKLKKTANFQADRFVFYPERRKNNTMQVPFRCIVPRAALGKASRLVLFGHGPYAGQDDVLRPDVQQLAQEGNLTFCAARQAGYATEDLATLKAAFADVNTFPRVVDRLQQGALNSLMLGRLMIHPQGLVRQAAFQTPAGTPAIDRFTVYYDTISGGAFGGMVTALSPDSVRASLGTGGMNHTFMLPRSTDYAALEPIFRAAYPGRGERTLLLSMLRASGTAARRPGTRRASRRTRSRARRCTRCSTRPPSATIASRTSRPRSRRARSRPSSATRSTTGAVRRTRSPASGSPRAASSSSARCSRCGTAAPCAPAGSARRSRRPGRSRRRWASIRTTCPRRPSTRADSARTSSTSTRASSTRAGRPWPAAPSATRPRARPSPGCR
jgi:hypothetical protein